MILPKFSPSELKRNIRFILFNPPTWLQFIYFLAYNGNWVDRCSDVKVDYSILSNKRLGITYHSPINYRRMIVVEWLGWEKHYRFPFSLNGKTVLDIGAGCGETALFFNLKGAKKIICIEQNSKLIPFLKKNGNVNGIDMQIINEPFNLKYLELGFDAVKMDIDGGEIEFEKMEGPITFPMVAEIHGPKMENLFLRKGLRIRSKPRETNNAIMNNFWRFS